MKGKLEITKTGWVVKYNAASTENIKSPSVLTNANNWMSLKLHPDDVTSFMSIHVGLYNGMQVDFERIELCDFNFTSRCTKGRCDCKIVAKLTHKLVNPSKTWEDVHKEYLKYQEEQLAKPQGASDLKVFWYWLELNYKIPEKK